MMNEKVSEQIRSIICCFHYGFSLSLLHSFQLHYCQELRSAAWRNKSLHIFLCWYLHNSEFRTIRASLSKTFFENCIFQEILLGKVIRCLFSLFWFRLFNTFFCFNSNVLENFLFDCQLISYQANQTVLLNYTTLNRSISTDLDSSHPYWLW